jgi:hypothetical protein
MMRRVRFTSLDASLRPLVHSGLVWAGLLLVAVGLGDAIAGRLKITQYQEAVRSAPSVEPRDPAALFPTASEGQERRAVALAKLGFYQLLFTSGQILAATGFLIFLLGILRTRFRGLQPATLAKLN